MQILPSIFIFIFGAIIGSFLNVVILRIHSGKPFVSGRSKCPKCKNEIKWRDNIPIISFLLLYGKCRYCKKKISFQYPLVEFATGFLFVLTYFSYKLKILDYELLFFRDLIFISILIIIFVYDFRWYLILDKITLPAIIFALVINSLLGISFTNIFFSAIIGGSIFLLQFLISRGKWVGGGDIRLGALIGAMLGFSKLILTLFLSYTVGSLIAVILLIFNKKKFGDKLPMGTFLAIGAIIALLWGEGIISWYLTYI